MRHYFANEPPKVEIKNGLVHLDVGHRDGSMVVCTIHTLLEFMAQARLEYAKWESDVARRGSIQFRKEGPEHQAASL